jgi:hypothetical protein
LRKQGFRPACKETIRPESGEESTVDFKLEPGPGQNPPFERTQAEIEQLNKKTDGQKKL